MGKVNAKGKNKRYFAWEVGKKKGLVLVRMAFQNVLGGVVIGGSVFYGWGVGQ